MLTLYFLILCLPLLEFLKHVLDILLRVGFVVLDFPMRFLNVNFVLLYLMVQFLCTLAATLYLNQGSFRPLSLHVLEIGLVGSQLLEVLAQLIGTNGFAFTAKYLLLCPPTHANPLLNQYHYCPVLYLERSMIAYSLKSLS
jgi:hypothetical protein